MTDRPRRLFRGPAFAGVLVTVAMLGGCNDAQSGALIGAGMGALAGQAIGGTTESTLIGTAVGAGAGYMIGNESDKTRHRQHGHHHRNNYQY